MQSLKNVEGGLAAALEKHHIVSEETVAAAPATPTNSAVLARFESHPKWSSVGPTDQARIRVLALDADSADVLTGRSVPEIADRHGWTPAQVKETLKALRRNGIAHAVPQWDLSGRNPRQAGSMYVVAQGTAYFPQAKRELSPAQRIAAQKRATSRAAKKAAKTRRQIARLLPK